VNTPGIFGIIGLQGLVAVAALLYFRRHPSAAVHPLVRPLTVAAAVLLFAVMLLIALNIDLLTFADPLTNMIILAAAPLVFLGGLLAARWLRRRRPSTYSRIGSFESHDA
jgi:uncharacterized membrane protein YfcA